MPLTHVCIWSDKNWKRITAYNASKMFPDGASAHSGLFMCELCLQYVSLAGGNVQAPHFRHSASEQNKDCEDRSNVYGYSRFFQPEAHGLPLRINIKDNNKFELELGFIQIPDHIMTKAKDHTIIISSGQSSTGRYVYSFSRLNMDGTTYLPIGNELKDEYKVSVSPDIEGITAFWPNRIEGILPSGVVFDAVTKKKLPYDADVIVGHEYLIVKRGRLSINKSSIRHSEICEMDIEWEKWYVHKVMAKDFSESAARFFLDYHCRLTDKPINMYPVWPVHITTPYVVFHQAKEIYMYFQGEAEIRLGPTGNVRKIPRINPKMLIVSSSEKSRQQLLSAGRTRVLNYTYLWQKDLDEEIENLSFIVRDLNGEMVQQGIVDSFPPSRTIVVHLDYDGLIIVKENNRVIFQDDIKAEKDYWLDNLSFNQKVSVYQGCDLIWEASYRKKKTISDSDISETVLLRKLKACSTNYIVADHSLGTLILKYNEYPKVKVWIYKAIRRGFISRDALRILKAGVISRED